MSSQTWCLNTHRCDPIDFDGAGNLMMLVVGHRVLLAAALQWCLTVSWNRTFLDPEAEDHR